MSLTAVLENHGKRGLRARAHPLPTISTVHRAAVSIAQRFDASAKLPAAVDLQGLLRKFRDACSENTLAQFSRREWGKVIWGVWDSACPLAYHDTFWRELRRFLETQNRRMYYKNLILAYLREFQSEDPGISKAARLIRGFLAEEGQAEWLWTRRHTDFRLFDPTDAAKNVTSFVLSPERDLKAALKAIGFEGILAGQGMERAAFVVTMQTLQRLLAESGSHATLLRALEWAERDGTLRFKALQVQLADTLLLPWIKKHPDDGTQAVIQGFLLKHYRDPRIDRRSWVGVSEAAQAVLRRWLTKTSLEQFIRVVTRVADAGHWKYRRAFWMAYYERDLIDEAWVLFGREARSIAAVAFEEQVGFGRMSGGLSNHCVLLMRIGGLTIADWSHSGSCRIWNQGNHNAPQLYGKHVYSAQTLRGGADFEQAHHASALHTWQTRVSAYIRDKTGAWVQKSKWVAHGR